jgi:hypothetical protein
MNRGVMMPSKTETDTTARPRASVPPPSNLQITIRTRFEYQIARLRTEIRSGAPRSNLEVLVKLCEFLVDQCGSGPIVDHYRTELGQAKAAVAWCTDARVVR